jgi:phage portal protein BeeE
VFACRDLIARLVSTLPVAEYERAPDGRLVKVDRQPDMLTEPEPDVDITDWLYGQMFGGLLTPGMAFGMVTAREYTGRGVAARSIAAIPSSSVSLRPRSSVAEPPQWQVEGTDVQTWPAGPLWLARGYPMPGSPTGLSPLGLARLTIQVGMGARQFAWEFFRDGATPAAVITHADEQSAPVRQAVQRAWVDESRDSREPRVLTGGWQYVPARTMAEESQFLSTINANAADVARFFGVSPEDIGASSGSGSVCVDEATEILTTRGWLRQADLAVGDSALTLNMDTGLAEWQPVLRVYVFDGEHDVIELRTKSHSSVSTVDHRWPVVTERGYREGGRLSWRHTADMSGSDRVLAAAPVANGPSEAKWSDAFVELVAWFYTEGYVSPTDGIRIAQSHRINPANCTRIRAALTDIFGPPAIRKHVRSTPEWVADVHLSGVTHFRLNKNASRELLRVAPGKVPAVWWLSQLTQAQLRMFIDVSIAADGSTTAYGTPVLAQKDRRRLDAFQVACALAGLSGNVRQDASGRWFMAIQKSAYRKPLGHAHYVNRRKLTGVVWCPRVENGTWLARREGTVYFTGNTYANVEQRQIQLLVRTIGPWLVRLERRLSTLRPPGREVRFDVDALLRTDATTRSRIVLDSIFGGVLSVNEARAMEDRAGIGPDGDRFLWPPRRQQLSQDEIEGRTDIGSDPGGEP